MKNLIKNIIIKQEENKVMTAEEFSKVEKLKIVKACYVDGKFCKEGTFVEKAGNDKVELLASKKAEKASDKK